MISNKNFQIKFILLLSKKLQPLPKYIRNIKYIEKLKFKIKLNHF